MLTADNNQSSFLLHLSSPSSPSDLFPSFPLSISLCVFLSFTPCDPQECPLVRSLLEAWMQSMLRTILVSHSLGKQGGGSLCSLTAGHMLLYACNTGRSGQGTLEKLRTLCPEEVMRGCPEGSLQTDGLCGPLRASTALLCHAGRK